MDSCVSSMLEVFSCSDSSIARRQSSCSKRLTIVRDTTLRAACGVRHPIRVGSTRIIDLLLIVWPWQLARAWPLLDEYHEAGDVFGEFVHIMPDEPHFRGRFTKDGFVGIFHSRLESVARLFNQLIRYMLDVPWTYLEDDSTGDLPVYHAHVFVRLRLLSFLRDSDPKALSCLDLKLRISKPLPCLAPKDYPERGTTIATMKDTGNRGERLVYPASYARRPLDGGQQRQQSKSRRQVSPSPSGSASHLGPSNVSVSSVGSKRRRASITQPEDLGGDGAASVVDARALKKQKLAVEDNVSSRTRASTSQTAGPTATQDDVGTDAAASAMGGGPRTPGGDRGPAVIDQRDEAKQPDPITAAEYGKGPRAARITVFCKTNCRFRCLPTSRGKPRRRFKTSPREPLSGVLNTCR